MARWACRDRPRTILDPALGRGVFVDAVLHLQSLDPAWPTPRIDAFELDPALCSLQAAGRLTSAGRSHCRNADFLASGPLGAYDAVIANPPYIRHHELAYGDDLFRRFDRQCGARISRTTNLYGLFLLKIWSLLAPGGRAAVITPAEWLNADFGVALKRYLLAENAIEGLVHFDPAASVFEGVLTTACITLLRRGRRPGDPLRLCTAADARGLTAVRPERGRPLRRGDLDPAAKWTVLFEGGAAPLLSARGGVLGDVATCTRGIATGANDFFTLSEPLRREWGIDRRDLVPCITRARQVRGDRLEAGDVAALAAAGERVYLLRPRCPPPPAVRRYLDEGRRRGVHLRHLPAHRPVWYMPEQRRPAEILVSVFARGAFRFVLNEAGVLNLTAYHGIYLRPAARRSAAAIFDYLRGPEAQDRLRRHRRIYADGLFKLEPRDVEALDIPRQFL
jgi:adenine-specific DNA-methyltransferase